MFYYLQTGVILQKCVILLPLKRFESPSYKVMLNLRGVKLQLGLKPLCRSLTHSVYSVPPSDAVQKKKNFMQRIFLVQYCHT